MGEIKDGSISGVLPSNRVFTVNYPGYPSSMERALVTLGGAEGIAKARQSPSNNLELRFRPEDPYSHPVFGELQPCNNFLLKISQHKKKGVQPAGRSSPNVEHDTGCSEATHGEGPSEINAIAHLKEDEAQISEGPEDKLYADIVGHVSEAYNFNGMVDYQHVLAVHADAVRRKKRNWADVEPQFEKHGLIDADQEDLMILVPPLFSLKNIPENVVLKPSMYVGLKKKQEGTVQHHWEMDIDPSLAIDFNIKDVPKKVNWEKFIDEGTNEWNCQMAVCELFDERPVWIRQSLHEHLSGKGLKLASHSLKRLLFRAAYYFANGPFLRFWIRKGYDPRKDPESRIYQRTDFRVPPSLRSYCDAGIASGLKHKWEDLCAFRVFPYKCQTSLQLFELADDYIQQEIKKPSTQATCTLGTGWFSPQILDILRLCVAVRFLSVYPHPGAEELVKSASSRFEKLKRTSTVMKEQMVNDQRLNREHVVIEEKEMSNDEDEDDDMEEDEMEEEFDAYEGVDMGGDGTNFLPEPSDANISKNYLQELFGSFPYNGNGGGQDDGENSDGEYQIYDEYSDGNQSGSDDDY